MIEGVIWRLQIKMGKFSANNNLIAAALVDSGTLGWSIPVEGVRLSEP